MGGENGGRFRDRAVIITGGGRGIGRETAVRFAMEGARVAVLNTSTAHAAVADIAGAGGIAVAVTVDVTQAAQVTEAIATAIKEVGPPAVLINNAGGGRNVSMSSDEADWDHEIDLNLTSVFLVSSATWPAMVERGGGAILTVSSTAAWSTRHAGMMAYGAAKAGVIALTKYMAKLGAPHGIRVNCVVPGYVQTPTFDAWLADMDDPDAVLSAMQSDVPIGRLGTGADVAEAHLYLASDAAAWVTGSVFLADGGLSL